MELLFAILDEFDLQTLTDFRRVNQRAMEIVDSISEYDIVVKHAPDTLRGILSLKTGRWITRQLLYYKLCTSTCEYCGDFGGYLYLLTCKRVCFLCFAKEQRFLFPLELFDACHRFGLKRSDWVHPRSRTTFSAIPHMTCLTGYYSIDNEPCDCPLYLMDHESARNAGAKKHGSESAMEEYVFDLATLRQARKQRVINAGNGRLQQAPLHLPGETWNFKQYTSYRFMAVVRAPCWNKDEGVLEWGFHCRTCSMEHTTRSMHRRRKFTAATFEDHIKECGEIRDGRHQAPGA